MDPHSDEFVQLLTASQPALYASVLSLLPDRNAAQDILQETNLTLWHKAEDFQEGTNFLAWASRIARYHVLNYRRKRSREKLVFDENLFEELAARQAERDTDAGRYADPLRKCLETLPSGQRELLSQRYAPEGSVQQIAAERGQSVGAVSQALYRIREALLDCVYQRLQSAGTGVGVTS